LDGKIDEAGGISSSRYGKRPSAWLEWCAGGGDVVRLDDWGVRADRVRWSGVRGFNVVEVPAMS
jgi:hypothetical protein